MGTDRRKAAFRLEGGAEIGMGHAVRCSVLAAELAKRGFECVFFGRPNDDILRFAERNNIAFEAVPRLRLTEEAQWFSARTADFSIIVIDSYLLSDEYIALQSAPGRIVCCIDDNALYEYSCDFLVNYNFFATRLRYRFGEKAPKLLLGGGYCLTRDEFRQIEPITVKENASQVFVCFGGSDPDNITQEVVRRLQRIEDIHLVVAVGPANRNADKIRKSAAENTQVFVDPPSIGTLMAASDMAVVSAGSIVYEIASLGLPSVFVAIAENQLRMREYMDDKGFSAYSSFSQDGIEDLCEAVKALKDNPAERQRQSAALTAMASREGASRIVNEVQINTLAQSD